MNKKNEVEIAKNLLANNTCDTCENCINRSTEENVKKVCLIVNVLKDLPNENTCLVWTAKKEIYNFDLEQDYMKLMASAMMKELDQAVVDRIYNEMKIFFKRETRRRMKQETMIGL